MAKWPHTHTHPFIHLFRHSAPDAFCDSHSINRIRVRATRLAKNATLRRIAPFIGHKADRCGQALISVCNTTPRPLPICPPAPFTRTHTHKCVGYLYKSDRRPTKKTLLLHSPAATDTTILRSIILLCACAFRWSGAYDMCVCNCPGPGNCERTQKTTHGPRCEHAAEHALLYNAR